MKKRIKRFFRSIAKVGKNFLKLSTKEKLQVLLFMALFIAVIWALFVIFKPVERQMYDVAVMVRSQSNSDPVEDRKNSLKAGDVLNIKEADHDWSKVEEVSYLILKMNLSEEEKEKLMMHDEREIEFDELSEEEQQRIEEDRQRAEEAGEEYYEEPRTEILRMRKYGIDFEKLRKKYEEFEDFKAVDLLNVGQPFAEDKVFDWSIVEKKEAVK